MVDRREFQRLLFDLVDEAEAAGAPYPEMVAIDRFMRVHGRYEEDPDE